MTNLARRSLLILAISLFGTACSIEIDPGNVGLLVDQRSDERELTAEDVVTGKVYFNPWSTTIYQFPTYFRPLHWTLDPEDDNSPGNQAFYFNSSDGVQINVDVHLLYAYRRADVPTIFTTFRATPAGIAQGYVREEVLNAFGRAASVLPLLQIYGTGREQFLETVFEDIQARLGPQGFRFKSLSLASALRLPPKVIAALHGLVDTKVGLAKTEAQVRRGTFQAEQKRIVAQGDLEAAKLQAAANKVLEGSLTPQVLEYMRLQLIGAKVLAGEDPRLCYLPYERVILQTSENSDPTAQ